MNTTYTNHLALPKGHVSFCLLLAFCVIGFSTTIQATIIADWGGDYLNANRSIGGTEVNPSGSSRLYAYSDTTNATPSTPYSAPPGKSGTLYSGSYFEKNGGGGNTTYGRNVLNNGANDTITFRKTGSLPSGYTSATFIAFLKEDFLSGSGVSDVVTFTSGNSMSFTLTEATNSEYRFAVMNGSTWYLHSATYDTTGSQLTLSGSSLLSDNAWGAWDPNGGANGQLGVVPSTFDTQGSSFSNIQAVGFFALSTFPTNVEGFSASLSTFTVDASIIPESGTTALLFGVGMMVAVFRYRRPRGE